ncbi:MULTISPECIES: HAD family hydrolase [unclassified Bradyrhizobium]|uniref:HAD family hydrolase n=1 Tax=unclassified Bradyrhizobium TaxID=2631580 RepID=UPI0028988308|nr:MULTISPECIES: HAD family hydrolase [unclassified Bradyrhizobium]
MQTLNANFDLIIFDCDGVLVDSEVISCRVHAEVLTRHGYPITAEQVHQRFLGRTSLDATTEVERELGRPLAETYEHERQTTLFAALAEAVEPIPHLHETLDAIDLRKCVASSAVHEKIFASLSRVKLYERFAPHIFSGSQVRNGKPAPDLFLLAAGQMKVPPARCLVIEDSVAGVTGGWAAGMTVLGFHGGSHCRPDTADTLRAAGAAVTFDDMRQLPDLIARIGAD